MPDKPSYSPESLYRRRMVVLMETGPQTDKYYQVVLSKDHVDRLREYINEELTPCAGNAIYSIPYVADFVVISNN